MPSDFEIYTYPNPFSDELSIELPQAAEVVCMDLNGRTVFSSKLNAGITALPTATWSSGMYVLFVAFPEGSSQGIKVVKQ